MHSLNRNISCSHRSVTSQNKTRTIVGGVISGLLGLFIVFVAVFCFLRRRKSRQNISSEVPYSPIEPNNSPQLDTRQLPLIRTITPLVWPPRLSQNSDTANTSINTADNNI